MDLFDDTCGTCVHFQGGPEGAQGQCYRYPPLPVPVMQQAPTAVLTPDKRQPQGFGVMSVRAPVNADTPACGEHETPDQGAIGYTEPSAKVD